MLNMGEMFHVEQPQLQHHFSEDLWLMCNFAQNHGFRRVDSDPIGSANATIQRWNNGQLRFDPLARDRCDKV